jgi:enoyl-[acyl-carrier protein] reductase / trans-2-enoyl-CoA reductase (NAD+)
MIIQPKVRGFICTTAHPIGCAKAVVTQIDYVKEQGKFPGPKNVLIIGASTGYGLASRIVSAFGCGANTIGISFERAADEKRTATAGYYNTAAFEECAQQAGYYAKSINGDAFSHEVKRQTVDLIKQDLGTVDLVIYSLASPRRVHPDTGEVYSSVLKPIGQSFTGKTVDPFQGEVKPVTLEPASETEIAHTVAVMGGEDWEMWLDYLISENVLAEGAITVAYSYVGPELTHAIYKEGTIGKAKEHLHQTAQKLSRKLQSKGGRAYISVNKALVTQASAAIPVVPLYISLLYKLMKEKGTHEGCIEQIERLFQQFLYGEKTVLDDQGLIRLDDWEMQEAIQAEINRLWSMVTTENLATVSDIAGYRDDFYRLFGFNMPGVDYNQDVNPDLKIPSLSEKVEV